MQVIPEEYHPRNYQSSFYQSCLYLLLLVPTPANYNRFVESVRMASRRHIPRGCRTEFIPGLIEESKSLYEAYKTQYPNSPFDDGTMESGNALLDSMIEEKKRRWEEVIT